MKFEIGKQQFLDALKAVGPGVAARSHLPILAGVRLEAAAGRLDLQTTDLEICIRLQVRASSDADAPVVAPSVVVPAKALTKAIGVMQGEVLRVETAEDQPKPRMTISSCEGRSISLECYPAEDWPAIASDVNWQRLGSFDGADLAQALSRVTLCASQDEARPVLTGVQFGFRADAGIAELVATDSYRLGVVKLPTEIGGSPEAPNPLVPARAMKAIARQLAGRVGRVDIYVGAAEPGGSPRYVEFAFGDGSWVVREIEGAFPEWQRLIPVKETGSLEYDAKEMADAIKAAASLRSAKSVPVRIGVGDVCTVRLIEDGVAVVTEDLGRATYSPNGTGALDLAFNADWVGDAVRFVGGKRQRAWVGDALKPAFFLSPEKQDCCYLLMPVRLS